MLRVRWLGRVGYGEALDLQRRLSAHSTADYLLLLEHPPVYTAGAHADMSHLLVEPASVGAQLAHVERGGDLTFHGPGQLVGYPLLTLNRQQGAGRHGGGLVETSRYVACVEQVLIDALADVGLAGCGRLRGYAGVWVEPDGDAPRKIAAIGVRLRRGRTLHGFALNVTTDLDWYRHIVPCGIADFGVTSLAAEGVRVTMADVVEAVAQRAAGAWAPRGADGALRVERADVASLSSRVPVTLEQGHAGDRGLRRLAQAGVREGLALRERKPSWLRAKLAVNDRYRHLRRVMASGELVTVCEEAGCPNIFECWGAGTATFMINGADCTRACGFCAVSTAKPQPLDANESARVATAAAQMGLGHVVVTAVARDDLLDGGASGFAATVAALRRSSFRRSTPGSSLGGRAPTVEVLVPDFGGSAEALAVVLGAKPDVVNHNIETVARLQRAVRPSAGYARSLALLARATDAGFVTKSGVIVGMGERDDEVDATLADLAGVGVQIVTIGQYLRPTAGHLPVARWVEPEQFDRWRDVGLALGIGHVESSPLTRSSYRAERGVDALASAG